MKISICYSIFHNLGLLLSLNVTLEWFDECV